MRGKQCQHQPQQWQQKLGAGSNGEENLDAAVQPLESLGHAISSIDGICRSAQFDA